MIAEGHTCTLWKPEITLGDQRQVLTTPYVLSKANVDCRFHEMGSRMRMELGIAIDAAADLQAVYFRGENIIEFDRYYILKWIEEGTFWLVNLPVNHTTNPKNYWRGFLQLLQGVPANIEAYNG